MQFDDFLHEGLLTFVFIVMESSETLFPIFIFILCSLLDVGSGDGSDFKMEVIVGGAVIYTLDFGAPRDAEV